MNQTCSYLWPCGNCSHLCWNVFLWLILNTSLFHFFLLTSSKQVTYGITNLCKATFKTSYKYLGTTQTNHRQANSFLYQRDWLVTSKVNASNSLCLSNT